MNNLKQITNLLILCIVLTSCNNNSKEINQMRSLLLNNAELNYDLSYQHIHEIEYAYYENKIKAAPFYKLAKHVDSLNNSFLQSCKNYKARNIDFKEFYKNYSSIKDSIVKHIRNKRIVEVYTFSEDNSNHFEMMKLDISYLHLIVLKYFSEVAEPTCYKFTPLEITVSSMIDDSSHTKLALNSVGLQQCVKRIIKVDTVLFNKTHIESPFSINSVYQFSELKAKDLKKGTYSVSGKVDFFATNSIKEEIRFQHEFVVD